MRNTNWTVIGIGALLLGILLYLMMQSNKQKENAEYDVNTSMDITEEPTSEPSESTESEEEGEDLYGEEEEEFEEQPG